MTEQMEPSPESLRKAITWIFPILFFSFLLSIIFLIFLNRPLSGFIIGIILGIILGSWVNNLFQIESGNCYRLIQNGSYAKVPYYFFVLLLRNIWDVFIEPIGGCAVSILILIIIIAAIIGVIYLVIYLLSKGY